MSKIPLYKTIVHDLKSKILSHELVAHDKVPTEMELSKQYDVSRITSKRALTELENENLIYRVQGKGSFVSEAPSQKKRTTRSKDILFILPFPNNPDLGNYAQGMMKELRQKPYQLHIQPDTILEEVDVKTLLDKYAGMILYPSSSNSHLSFLFSISLYNFPTILLDKQSEGLNLTTITADNFQGGYEATTHLINLGHKKISFVSMVKIEDSSSVRDRYLGYLKALHDHQITFQQHDMFPTVQDEASLTHFSQQSILNFQTQEITGIVAENDITAIMLMKLIRRNQLNVPEDLAVVGFDNIQASALVDPSLTTISQDFEQMGYLAMKNLIKLIEEKKNSPKTITVPVKLIERESTN